MIGRAERQWSEGGPMGEEFPGQDRGATAPAVSALDHLKDVFQAGVE